MVVVFTKQNKEQIQIHTNYPHITDKKHDKLHFVVRYYGLCGLSLRFRWSGSTDTVVQHYGLHWSETTAHCPSATESQRSQ